MDTETVADELGNIMLLMVANDAKQGTCEGLNGRLRTRLLQRIREHGNETSSST